MQIKSHFLVSSSLAILVAASANSYYAGIICFCAGILPDLDHFIEYILHFGIKGITLKKVYATSVKSRDYEGPDTFSKLYLLFHSHELLILLWAGYFFGGSSNLLALATGYSSHLIMDLVGNPVHFMGYSIICRAIKNFDLNKFHRPRVRLECLENVSKKNDIKR